MTFPIRRAGAAFGLDKFPEICYIFLCFPSAWAGGRVPAARFRRKRPAQPPKGPGGKSKKNRPLKTKEKMASFSHFFVRTLMRREKFMRERLTTPPGFRTSLALGAGEC